MSPAQPSRRSGGKQRDRKSRKKDKRKRKSKQRKPTLAERADRHVLYQQTVQCVEAEIDFVDETFRELRGRKPKWLREDFCGTANTACEWVRRRRTNHAIAVDVDADVLAWGRENNVASLGSGAQRIELVQENVLDVRSPPVDIVLAMNFSYWLFEDRPTMRGYFERVRHALVDDGIFFLDAYGGSESFEEVKDRHKYDGYTYIWEQESYNPIDGHMVCHIHFHFPDGSKLKKAFSYEWRLWTLPELRELLDEAGFRRVTVYWEGTDEETGEGNGEFEPAEVGDADPAWITYIVAEK